ncbi:MAG: hypothetical protein ACU0DK_00820 [Pseudooceanicola sp.]
MSDTVSPGSERFQYDAAVTCNNAAWGILELPEPDAGQLARLVMLAATARFHWQGVGDTTNQAHANLLYGWALARSGAGDAARHASGEALNHFAAHGEDWERAFAHAAMSAALAVAGDAGGHADHFVRAAALGEELTGQNRQYFEKAFAVVPAPG